MHPFSVKVKDALGTCNGGPALADGSSYMDDVCFSSKVNSHF